MVFDTLELFCVPLKAVVNSTHSQQTFKITIPLVSDFTNDHSRDKSNNSKNNVINARNYFQIIEIERIIVEII